MGLGENLRRPILPYKEGFTVQHASHRVCFTPNHPQRASHSLLYRFDGLHLRFSGDSLLAAWSDSRYCGNIWPCHSLDLRCRVHNAPYSQLPLQPVADTKSENHSCSFRSRIEHTSALCPCHLVRCRNDVHSSRDWVCSNVTWVAGRIVFNPVLISFA